jgi:hypothetical protein
MLMTTMAINTNAPLLNNSSGIWAGKYFECANFLFLGIMGLYEVKYQSRIYKKIINRTESTIGNMVPNHPFKLKFKNAVSENENVFQIMKIGREFFCTITFAIGILNTSLILLGKEKGTLYVVTQVFGYQSVFFSNLGVIYQNVNQLRLTFSEEKVLDGESFKSTHPFFPLIQNQKKVSACAIVYGFANVAGVAFAILGCGQVLSTTVTGVAGMAICHFGKEVLSENKKLQQNGHIKTVTIPGESTSNVDEEKLIT